MASERVVETRARREGKSEVAALRAVVDAAVAESVAHGQYVATSQHGDWVAWQRAKSNRIDVVIAYRARTEGSAHA